METKDADLSKKEEELNTLAHVTYTMAEVKLSLLAKIQESICNVILKNDDPKGSVLEIKRILLKRHINVKQDFDEKLKEFSDGPHKAFLDNILGPKCYATAVQLQTMVDKVNHVEDIIASIADIIRSDMPNEEKIAKIGDALI